MGGGSPPMPATDGSTAPRRHPDWIRARMPSGENYHDLKGLMRGLGLNTVCEEAHCPNIGECWDQRTATIMILGDTCTRACGFCAVKTGRPTWFDDDEPRRVAEAVGAMGLEHVVVTSVARDDLPDGGVGDLRRDHPPDARTSRPGWASRCSSPTSTAPTTGCGRSWTPGPDILNHNLETVKRLQKPVRKRARWDRSLYVLRRAKEMAGEIGYAAHTKSSLMVGLGETRAELTEAFEALREADVDILTDRPVPAAVAQAPAARALLPPRRVRRDEGRGPGARVQARRIGADGPLQLPRPRSGARRRTEAPAPPGDDRCRRPGDPARRLTRPGHPSGGWGV